MALTFAKLDGAIANVLGLDVATALQIGCVPRTTRHQMAINKAFTYGCSDEDAAVLRETQIMLDTNGQYEFG